MDLLVQGCCRGSSASVAAAVKSTADLHSFTCSEVGPMCLQAVTAA